MSKVCPCLNKVHLNASNYRGKGVNDLNKGLVSNVTLII